MADSVGLAPDASLEDRILEAQVRLSVIDQEGPESEADKMIAECRLNNLKRMHEQEIPIDPEGWQREESLKGLQDRQLADVTSLPQRPYSSDGTAGSNAAVGGLAGNTQNTFDTTHFASDGLLMDPNHSFAAPSWTFGNMSDNTASITPTGSNEVTWPSSASISSPDSAFGIPQKRQRDQTGSSPAQRVDKRHQAFGLSSQSSTVVSPESSEDMDGVEIPEELFDLFGGDPRAAARELRESRREQEAHDKMIAEKREQEQRDEALAWALQQEDQDTVRHPSSNSQAGPSRRQSNQTYFDPAGSYNPPQPQLLPSSSQPGANDPFNRNSNQPVYVNNIHAPSTSGALAQVTPQAHSQTYSAAPHPTSDDFINIDSDDDDLTGGLPSSSLMEGSPQAWQQANALDQAGPTPRLVPALLSLDREAATAAWQAVSNTAQNIYSGAADLVYGRASELGGTSVYGNAGQGLWNSVIDLDAEDGQFTGSTAPIWPPAASNPPYDEEMAEIYRSRYDYIYHDPTKTRAEIRELLENIRPDEDLAPENREGTPEAMVYPLMEHQKLGLAWMKRMEDGTNRGGILADAMGLGKTIQALALISSKRSTNPQKKTTLIVAPVALLKQWEREIQKKLKPTKEHRMSCFILHGPNRNTTWEKLKTFDVVLTTFGILATEVKLETRIKKNKTDNPNWRPSSNRDRLCLLGDECRWYRVIIDEAQCIKNKNAQASIGARKLRADSRFCMTGTPMMNNVEELFSLIFFLRIKPYDEDKVFSRDIARPIKSDNERTRNKAMRQLQALLKSILLRRTKKSEIDGKPILNLPERTTESLHSEFSEDEVNFYRALETQSQLQFNRYLRAGTVGRHYSNILVLLLRLRQACCHPHLIKDFGMSGGPSDLTTEEMVELAQQLEPAVVARIKETAAQNDNESLECPVCIDMADNATIFIPCGHNTCSECFARISDPSQAIARGDAGEGNLDVKCPNCRGKIEGKKVIDFNTFKKVHLPELMQDKPAEESESEEEETTDDSDETTDDSDDEDEQVDKKGNLKDFIVDSNDDESTTDDEADNNKIGSDVDKCQKRAAAKPTKKRSKGKEKAKPKKKDKGKGKEKVTPKTLAQLKKEAGLSSKARRKYLQYLEKDWVTSAKIDRTLEVLHDIHNRLDPETGRPEKTIIFSQFTSLLDLLEVPISRENWDYRRYDGSMSPKARNDAVIDFTDNPHTSIMLVSLKAGNAGLNLVAASQVIVFDPFWNPYIEEQAIDRAHRIGQQRPVKVWRMLVPNTVEDRILALQERKRELIESALDENASKSIGRLGTRELAFLFDVNHDGDGQ